MSTLMGGGPDHALLGAARDGDRRAQDALVGQCAPLIYNLVGRALDGPADTNRVVAETVRRMVAQLPDLSDPGGFRPWLVTTAVRAVSDHQRGPAAHRPAPPDPAGGPPGDFAGLTIWSLGLTGQRREAAEATRWIDPADRVLLSLWWLAEIGELTRDDLARALGRPAPDTDVLVARVEGQMTEARAVVRALAADPPCPALGHLAARWDGRPDPRWRTWLGGHLPDCGWCRSATSGLRPTATLLAGLPLVPVPAGSDPALPPPSAPGRPNSPGPALPAPPGPGRPALPGPAGPAALAAADGATALATGPLRPAPGGARPDPGPPGRPPAGAAPRSPAPARAPATSGAGAASRTPTASRAGGRPPDRPRGRSGARAFTPSAAPVPFLALAMLMVAVITATVLVRTSALPGARTTLSVAGPGAVATGATPRPGAVPGRAGTRTPAARTTVAGAGPSTRPPAVAPGPARPAISARKGVTARSFSGGDQALAASGAGWYYTWGTTHAGLTTPAGVRFVPTIWGASSVTSDALAEAKSNGPDLLTFNEPDRPDQANLSPTQALDLWPQLMASGMTLGSPAVSSGATDPDGWLGRFMAGASARGYRVDFITLHWYGSDFSATASTARLKAYIQAVYSRYHKPIWLTEYALINFSGGESHYPSDAQQAAFITASTQMLDTLPYLARYAWFTLPASDTGPSSGLYHSGARVTPAGRAFEAAR